MGKKLVNSLKNAFAMYSRLPVPGPKWTEENISYTMCFFPWVGAVIGIVTWAVFLLKGWIAAQGFAFGGLFFTILFVLIPLFITGGIHMDGFMDTTDALRSYQSKEQRLAILKDPHIGAFAAIALSMYLLADAALYSAVTARSMVVICLGFCLSRTLSAWSVIAFPKARQDGFAAELAKASGKGTRPVLVVYLVLLTLAMLMAGGIPGLVSLLAAGFWFLCYRWMSVRRFGGITGDLAGYFLQGCELFICAAAVITDVLIR